MLDPRNDLLPPPSSPTNSSVSSSDLDTEVTHFRFLQSFKFSLFLTNFLNFSVNFSIFNHSPQAHSSTIGARPWEP